MLALAESGEWVRDEVGEEDCEEGGEEEGKEDAYADEEEVDSSDKGDAHIAAPTTADPEPPANAE
eukprot:6195921-Pleurochrysis_carterae.AAC.1